MPIQSLFGFTDRTYSDNIRNPDGDVMLIMTLILLLKADGADMTLILALMYIMM